MDALDVLLVIRRAYGSAAAFERAHELPDKSVHDVVVRNRPSARVQRAVNDLLARKSELSANSRASAGAHRQNGKAA